MRVCKNGEYQRCRRFRPVMEVLEDRITPTGDPLIDLTAPPRAIQSVGGVLTATLTETVATPMTPVAVGDTSVVNAWTYNGLYVGPTLMANPGDLLDITIVNQLPDGQITNLHTHGLHVSPIGNSDNVLLEIEPGADNHYRIQIPADHPNGLYWYHPHHHGTVFDQISMGLSGLLVIGRPDGGATELNGFTQHVLALQNALLAGNQINVPAAGSDVSAQTFTVNSQLLPQLDIPAGRWDVFSVNNIGNNAFYNLAIVQQTGPGTYSARKPLRTFAVDGNPFEKVGGPHNSIGLPPGRRWSFSFEPSAVATTAADPYFLVSTGFSDGSNNWPGSAASPLLLLQINYTAAAPGPTPPTPGTSLTPPFQNYHDLRGPGVPIAAFRNVVFSNDGDRELINGQQFPNNPLFQPRLGTVEEWTLTNTSTDHHPFHLHVDPQQVTFVSIGQPNGLPQFQDVINVPPGATVKIRVEFLDFLGEFVYHCHRVDHEDMGMMALVNVIPNTPYYAVAANSGSRPRVKVFNAVSGALVSSFFAYDPAYRGGVNVAVGDVNGDGVYDIITGKTQGKTHVKVIDGTKLNQIDPTTGVISSSALLGSFLAFSPSFIGGVNVAVGDINADGLGDVIAGAGPGGPPRVNVVDATKLLQVNPNGQINSSALVAAFKAYVNEFNGGVRVAAGDINGDGRIDIVTGKAVRQALVKVFSGTDLGVIGSFLAYEPSFQGGVYVATGNAKGFAFDDIITGKGAGGRPLVKVFTNQHSMIAPHDELDLMQVDAFLAYEQSFLGGVRVSSLHDSLAIAPSGGNRDDIVTTRAVGDGTNASTFARTIPPP